MRLPLLTLFAAVAVATLAQTVNAPVLADHRFHLQWDDPNQGGVVTSWWVYASNNVVVRSIEVTNRFVEYPALMGNAPVGLTYAIFVVPRSTTLGDGDASTNHYIKWVGRMRGGGNLRSGR